MTTTDTYGRTIKITQKGVQHKVAGIWSGNLFCEKCFSRPATNLFWKTSIWCDECYGKHKNTMGVN